ncbi:hypothetical protein AAKU55_001276 [Oxalobacteraceae bacterium GrIS 1.11]
MRLAGMLLGVAAGMALTHMRKRLLMEAICIIFG